MSCGLHYFKFFTFIFIAFADADSEAHDNHVNLIMFPFFQCTMKLICGNGRRLNVCAPSQLKPVK